MVIFDTSLGYYTWLSSNLGLDIDWEYPKDDAEARDLVKLLEETRKVISHLFARDSLLISLRHLIPACLKKSEIKCS